jgi:hypothetical protein
MFEIEAIVENLRKVYEQKYGFAVFALRAKELRGRLVLSGEVLTESQRQEAVGAVKRAYGVEVVDRLQVLADAKSREAGWAIVKAPMADLRGRFVPSTLLNEKIRRRTRTSQVLRGEALRVLLAKDGQLLVQTGDLAMGWIDRKDLILKKDSQRRLWQEGVRAEADRLVAVKEGGRKAVEEAEKFLGTPYVLGGRSAAGIDCSGLTQVAYKNACGLILPRHSWDQKRMGKGVLLEKAETGDLVFMTGAETDTRHVGLFEKTAQGENILHACLGRGGVVRESAEEVLGRYHLAEVRRVIKK